MRWFEQLSTVRCGVWSWLILAVVACAPGIASAADSWTADTAGYDRLLAPFFRDYCQKCHAGDRPEGEFSVALDRLPNDFADAATRGRWREIVNVLNAHEMPPEKSKQPSPKAVADVVDWITAQAVRAEAVKRERVVVLRRLNRDEYRRTIRDLIGVDVDISGFPQDPPAGGFDNNGSALTLSPLHLEIYLATARQILDRALVEGDRPRSIKWHFNPRAGDADATRVRFDEHNNPIINGGANTERGDWVVVHDNRWDRGVNARDFRVPSPGMYVVRFRAASRIPDREEVLQSGEKILAQQRDEQMRENPKGKQWHDEAYAAGLKHLREDRMYDYGPARVKLVQQLGSQPRVVAEFDVDGTIDAPRTYEFPLWFTTESAGLAFDYAYQIPQVLENLWYQRRDEFARPELLVDWFEIEGPLYDAWPPTSHTRILFPPAKGQAESPAYVRAVLEQFLRRAYRRPPTSDEVTDKLELFTAAKSEGRSFIEAMKVTLTAVLTSPEFLFLCETPSGEPVAKMSSAPAAGVAKRAGTKEDSKRSSKVAGESPRRDGTKKDRQSAEPKSPAMDQPSVAKGKKKGNKLASKDAAGESAAQTAPVTAVTENAAERLDDYQLASRLSYFLWSSMPDEELFQLAERGQLRDPIVRRQQVTRLLADSRSEALVKNFAGQWLGLREVGANPPAAELYPQYDRHLELSIVRESEAYFDEFLRNDLDVRQMIRSDFVVINERLARFYGIPDVRGDKFRRVPVPEGVVRGGIVTQASILTITSNGTRTSPVKRGTWIMKTLLGIDPGLPVANAGEIAPKVPGIDKATVRKRLEIHRDLPQCARCHSKIDPLGFALENYNAAGEWRLQEGFGYQGRIERDDPLIDASSAMPDGTRIDGVRGLQQAMLKQDQLFLQALTGKLITYGLGRELGLADQPTVKACVADCQANGHSLRALLQAIVAQDVFAIK